MVFWARTAVFCLCLYACVRLDVHSVVVRRVKGGERGWFKHQTATPPPQKKKKKKRNK